MADITLLATADWDHPIWTNKQHVAVSLARQGHKVLYVDSLGLRGLRAQASDWRRVVRRIRRGFCPPRQVAPGLWVHTPLVWPGARGRTLTAVNRVLLQVGLAWARFCLRLRCDWLWTYNPRTLACLDVSAYRQVIYHSVDHIQSQPGMDPTDLDRWEALLCRRASIVFVTSPALADRLRPLNPEVHYFPNVADHAHFAAALDPGTQLPGLLTEIPKPRVGFIGAISAYKLDLNLLEQLATARPDWSFVLIGPVGEGDPATDITALQRLSNVYFISSRLYAELPAWLAGMDAAILPLQCNSYTDAMFPMKFFEYLAAGRPVVASSIRSLQPFADWAHLVAPCPDAFSLHLRSAMDEDSPAKRQERSAFASGFTYDRRTEQMLECVRAVEACHD
ncbi:glycosyltransferase [Vulcanococcus sp. Clear-D1]|uniref:glycosyltransferase n=1 Tax=Vulcanococcus sp. Clear-D1 TaxID=2766970 RepID=UPI0019A56D30|nr:glycosyltransferase [Vulcanococcus sp. Clear-D1]MBD1194211.1 glycosyltransferase [Vulcanococcus sp. Clear-D1]